MLSGPCLPHPLPTSTVHGLSCIPFTLMLPSQLSQSPKTHTRGSVGCPWAVASGVFHDHVKVCLLLPLPFRSRKGSAALLSVQAELPSCLVLFTFK